MKDKLYRPITGLVIIRRVYLRIWEFCENVGGIISLLTSMPVDCRSFWISPRVVNVLGIIFLRMHLLISTISFTFTKIFSGQIVFLRIYLHFRLIQPILSRGNMGWLEKHLISYLSAIVNYHISELGIEILCLQHCDKFRPCYPELQWK